MSEPATNLADFITAEVHRQASGDAIRKLVETGIEKLIADTVRSAFSFGDLRKQLADAVNDSLRVDGPLGLPGYGTMVMAMLRQSMDAIVSDIVKERLEVEAREILKLAPKEVKLSEIIEAMKKEEDESERFGTRATCIVEESENVDGYRTIYLDPLDVENRRDVFGSRSSYGAPAKHTAAVKVSVDAAGKIYHLTVDAKDPKTTISMGYLEPWKRTLFALYAAGGKLDVDGSDGDFDLSYGDC